MQYPFYGDLELKLLDNIHYFTNREDDPSLWDHPDYMLAIGMANSLGCRLPLNPEPQLKRGFFWCEEMPQEEEVNFFYL